MNTFAFIFVASTILSVSANSLLRFLHLTPSGTLDSSSPPLFQATFVTESKGTVEISSLSPCGAFSAKEGRDSAAASLSWSRLVIAPEVTVDIEVTAVQIRTDGDGEGYDINYTVSGVSSDTVGLWEMKINSPVFTRKDANIIGKS
jgi:hypothetical protein